MKYVKEFINSELKPELCECIPLTYQDYIGTFGYTPVWLYGEEKSSLVLQVSPKGIRTIEGSYSWEELVDKSSSHCFVNVDGYEYSVFKDEEG